MATPRTRKKLRSFLGLVKYYRDMTIRRSHIIAPLTKLFSKKVPFTWTKVHQKAFEKIKMILSEKTLHRYPVFSKEFEIHTDASQAQIGTVIAQEGKLIAFYSRKLRDCQTLGLEFRFPFQVEMDSKLLQNSGSNRNSKKFWC